MDGLAMRDAQGVLAPLVFMEPMPERPFSYNYEPPPGTVLRNARPETHQVKIIDARRFADRLSLDREGFVLLHRPTAATSLYDEDEIAGVYYPECERLIAEATGAARVLAFDHIVRNAALSAKGNQIKQPAARVHNDYTAWSAPQRVRDLMGAEAEALLRRRYAEINLWRPIRGPLLASPLALCDAQTLAEENLIASDLLYPDRKGEIYGVTYNPAQRWYYFPKMLADECVLIRCFDSARHGAARFSAHGAFDDPETPPNAPPRESIEVRALVFFND
ncbi:MAG TPA: CmcJ/NvfI family oxidoreductase [Stellaceae bacterium]|nr:CmcJ/NvfI family oxidoreductase [Stellaceae bacterium]